MIRRSLRPLARILQARSQGLNPDAIEAENLRLRREEMRDAGRKRAQGRLLVLAGCFAIGYGAIATRMASIAAQPPGEPQTARAAAAIASGRADIVDRNGRLLATNMETHALYAHPKEMVDAQATAVGLAEIFDELDATKLARQFTDGRSFMWIREQLSPEQLQQVHDLGQPGLYFGPREMRLYPNGKLAAHVLGGARFGDQSASSAELIGTAGVEAHFNDRLRDPAMADQPLQLSLDLTVQAATEQVLAGGMALMNAKGAASVLMDIHTGEVISIASLPSFDPNDRPAPLTEGDQSDSPLFNRAVQGVYELGSTFKIFVAAQAIDLGLVNAETMIETKGPLTASGQRIRDFHAMPAQMSVTDVIVESSNVGSGRLALMIGAQRQEAFLRALGLGEPTGLEMVEARTARPQFPPKWRDISAVTVSYGHGISVSPLHLAQAYASLLNGGKRVAPSLVRGGVTPPGDQIVSEAVSAQSRAILRKVVTDGTASFGEVEGYEVAGKTGTADKVKPRGGYYDDKVIATFASVFPASNPRYVLIVTLDEPVENSGSKPRRTAGWTAVPIAAEMIRRVAPLMGLRPDEGSYAPVAASLTERR